YFSFKKIPHTPDLQQHTSKSLATYANFFSLAAQTVCVETREATFVHNNTLGIPTNIHIGILVFVCNGKLVAASIRVYACIGVYLISAIFDSYAYHLLATKHVSAPGH
ncbi:unnamed protein product, partial [Ceratitis capitata]